MRAEITNRVRFAGLTAFDSVNFDSAMIARYGGDDETVPDTSLYQAVHELDPVELANIFVQNPYDEDQLIPLGSANATINPDIAVELARQAREEELLRVDGGTYIPSEEDGERLTFGVHSSEYAAVPHIEFFEPMVEAFREAEIHDIGGEFRVYDHGAQVHGEIIFLDPQDQLDLGGDRDPLFVGIQVGNSYDGSCSMYAQGYAMDTFCRNSMRMLTDKRSRKHVGDPDEAMEWWEGILTQMGALRDVLGEIIQEALDVEMDFLDLPFDVEEFYELLGFPSYLARAAAVSARNRSPREGGTRTTLNFWTLYSGATSALTHDFRGTSEIGSLENYYDITKDLLWNPVNTMDRVKTAYERREREEVDGESQLSLSGERGIAQIERFEMTLEERKTEFERNEENITQIISGEPQ